MGRVAAGSPAEAAGVRVGDWIVAWGGRLVRDAIDLSNAWRMTHRARPVMVRVRRGDTEVDLPLTVSDGAASRP